MIKNVSFNINITIIIIYSNNNNNIIIRHIDSDWHKQIKVLININNLNNCLRFINKFYIICFD
jgi:hypothetical protein